MTLDAVGYAQRLSRGDLLSGSSEPHLPRDFLAGLFPALGQPKAGNSVAPVELLVDSHGEHSRLRVDDELPGGAHNEAGLTGWGGHDSALLNPDNTGALAIFAFVKVPSGAVHKCHVWVCQHEDEADLFQDDFGPVEPGQGLVWSLFDRRQLPPANPEAARAYTPAAWAELLAAAMERYPASDCGPDERLLVRRESAHERFLEVTETAELPSITAGFASVDEFMVKAQQVIQWRKAYSDWSLERQVKAILLEEGLCEGVDFDHDVATESGRRVAFLVPSQAQYRAAGYAADRLRMLAVKTTCHGRWRQLLNDADRLKLKHLLTVDTEITADQFEEMKASRVQLVVPQGLHKAYPKSIRSELLTLRDFIEEVRSL